MPNNDRPPIWSTERRLSAVSTLLTLLLLLLAGFLLGYFIR